METIATLTFGAFIFVIIGALYGVGNWLDKRFGLQTIKWLNGESHSFVGCNTSSSGIHQPDSTDTAELKERIQVLEKLVTEPAYELNKKINQL